MILDTQITIPVYISDKDHSANHSVKYVKIKVLFYACNKEIKMFRLEMKNSPGN